VHYGLARRDFRPGPTALRRPGWAAPGPAGRRIPGLPPSARTGYPYAGPGRRATPRAGSGRGSPMPRWCAYPKHDPSTAPARAPRRRAALWPT